MFSNRFYLTKEATATASARAFYSRRGNEANCLIQMFDMAPILLYHALEATTPFVDASACQ